MSVLTSYHIHTTWSDGQNSLNEMVSAVQAKGIARAGISDHLVLLPERQRPDWSLTPHNVSHYASAVRYAVQKAGWDVYTSIEADFIPDAVNELTDILTALPFDYKIGAVHFVDGFSVDNNPKDWGGLSQSEVNDVFRRYWQLVRYTAESGIFDVLAHLDLPKKFGHAPTIDLTKEIEQALDAVAQQSLFVEVNTAGWNKLCREPYPCADILRSCRRRNIPTIITDDAHTPEQLAQHRAATRKVLHSCGLEDASARFLL